MKKTLLYTMVLSVALVVAIGCAKPPVTELDNARAALQAAQQAGAEKCATDEYNQALADMQAAEEELNAAGADEEAVAAANEQLAAATEAFNAARMKAEEKMQLVNQAQSELDALNSEINAMDADNSALMSAKSKADRVQTLIDECRGEEALALLEEAKADLERAKGMAAGMDGMDSQSGAFSMYTVVRGDNLWNISKMKYSNAFMWPLIYWANKANINDPDLIFPGQEFEIRTDYSDTEKGEATSFARNRGPWSLTDGK